MYKVGYVGYGITITHILRKESVFYNSIFKRYEHIFAEYAIDYSSDYGLKERTHFSWKKSCFCLFEYELRNILEERYHTCRRISSLTKELLIKYNAGLNEG